VGGLALIAVFWQKFVHKATKEEAMQGVKARTGGQRFSGRGVVKRQHSVGAGRVPAPGTGRWSMSPSLPRGA